MDEDDGLLNADLLHAGSIKLGKRSSPSPIMHSSSVKINESGGVVSETRKYMPNKRSSSVSSSFSGGSRVSMVSSIINSINLASSVNSSTMFQTPQHQPQASSAQGLNNLKQMLKAKLDNNTAISASTFRKNIVSNSNQVNKFNNSSATTIANHSRTLSSSSSLSNSSSLSSSNSLLATTAHTIKSTSRASLSALNRTSKPSLHTIPANIPTVLANPSIEGSIQSYSIEDASSSSVFIDDDTSPGQSRATRTSICSTGSNNSEIMGCQLSKLKMKQEEGEFSHLLVKCQEWIECISGIRFPYPNDFRKSLENGIILCELLNTLKQNCIRRINRHSTPMSGIDNLNLFLKACHEHFHITQSDLFDTIDLEDLNKRRGGYSDSDSTSKQHIDPIANILDEEQQRRLKKVVHTIYWLSRRASELDIPLDRYFDLNLSNTASTTTSTANSAASSNKLKPVLQHITTSQPNKGPPETTFATDYKKKSYSCSTAVDDNGNAVTSSNFHHHHHQPSHPANNISLNSLVSSTNSLLLSSSSFSSSISSKASTNSASLSISINNSSSSSSSTHANSNKLSTPKANAVSKSTGCSSTIVSTSGLVNVSNDIFQHNKSLSSSSSSSLSQSIYDCSDEKQLIRGRINNESTTNSTNPTMPYIYNSQAINSTHSKALTKNNNNVVNSSSPCVVTATTTNNASSNQLDSQEDLRIVDTSAMMSPISSIASTTASPRQLTNSSCSSNQNISHSTAINNNNNNNSQGYQHGFVPSAHQFLIPTRHVDRRVSTSVTQTDPYKFNVNYSEAGQRLARKAQEQLKTVEKLKEATGLDTPAGSSRRNSTDAFSSSINDANEFGEDWQYSVDDWKKKRRQKQRPSATRMLESGEDESTNASSSETNNQRSRRINKFENSQYYRMPLDDNNEPITTSQKNSQTMPSVDTNTATPASTGSKDFQHTLELTGITTTSSTTDSADLTSNDKSNQVESSQAETWKTDEKQNCEEQDETSSSSMAAANANAAPAVIYIYSERSIEINRPFNHSQRGFGFLLNTGLPQSQSKSTTSYAQNHIIIKQGDIETTVVNEHLAQVVVVEPDSLADKAGLKKGDLVIRINDEATNGLTNEQLRKIMRQRLQLNSISLLVFTNIGSKELDMDSLNNQPSQLTEGEPENCQSQQVLDQQLDITATGANEDSVSSSSSTINNKSRHISTTDYHQIVAPKPFRKSTSTSSPSTTSNSTQILNSVSTSSQMDERINTAKLIEKRHRLQLDTVLSWFKSSDGSSCSNGSLIARSARADSVDSLLDLQERLNLNFDKIKPFSSDSTISSDICKEAKNNLSDNNQEEASQQMFEQNIGSSSNMHQVTNEHEDDTDHDNDDFLDGNTLKPPPVPKSEPPPLPTQYRTVSPDDPSLSEQDIKKALFENMKSIENWKKEQEILMKKKYVEDQKRLEMSLKLDLEKVKEEESQRREQERLKLEKEKIRLQELELQQKEEELKKTYDMTSSLLNMISSPAGDSNDGVVRESPAGTQTVSKQDLNALIEKIYREQLNEPDIFGNEFMSSGTTSSKQTTSGSSSSSSSNGERSASQSPKNSSASKPPRSKSKSNGSANTSSNGLVVTKTSPLVAAELSMNEQEELLELNASFSKDLPPPPPSSYFTSLIDSDLPSKHHIIRQVQESMDCLKHELLNKSSRSSAEVNTDEEDDEETKALHEQLKLDQEMIQRERDKIEQEKERLRLEAEQLRIEREIILSGSNNVGLIGGVCSYSSSDSSTSPIMPPQKTYPEQYLDNSSSSPMPTSASAYLTESHSYEEKQRNSASPSSQHHNLQRMYTSLNPNVSDENSTHYQLNGMMYPGGVMNQNMRMSVPNLMSDSSPHKIISNAVNNTNSQMIPNQSGSCSANSSPYKMSSIMYQPINMNTRAYQSHNSRNQKQSQKVTSKPPPSGGVSPYHQYHHYTPTHQRVISTSHTELKPNSSYFNNPSNKSAVSKSSPMRQQPQTQQQTPPPPVSLNQKCAQCQQILGQGSAMYIEKLDLAFHLKCFRCSVCSVPLSNGKEGTDVRVSGLNRLHCNSCFSNDLGLRLSAV